MTPRPRKNAEKIRAVAYVRVSSEQQADSGLSLEHQQTKCRALATVNDYTLTDVIVDAGESAKTLDRPGMARVLSLVDKRQVEAVLVAKLDRITRSVSDLSDLLKRFARSRVALVSASESLNTESAGGRMVVKMLGVVAEWEREAIGERTSAALSAKRARGERAGTVPYGYRLRADDRTLTADAAERRILRLMLECREAGFSLRDTAAELNRKGYTTRAGQPWRHEYVRSAIRTLERQPDLLLAELG